LLLKDEQSLQITIEQKEQAVAELTVSLRQMEEAKRALENELGTELLAHLRPEEQSELRQLNDEIATRKTELPAAAAHRAELEGQKNALQNLLSANLLKRQVEIQEELGSLALVEETDQLQQRQRDLSLLQGSVQANSRRLKEIDREMEARNVRIRDLKVSIDDLKAAENKYAQQMQSESKNMEKLLNKRSLLLQKKEECMNKIRELGSLPSTVENYKGLERKELLRMLDQTSKQLQQYSQVNKKAGDQYVSFTQQHSELLHKKREADEAAQKIGELIRVLDDRKDVAIERTFKGVARHFQEVFSELVPDGSGYLVMQKSKEGAAAAEGQADGHRIAQYTGVAIKVSFSQSAETQHMQFLSGGQKSLVALALIFAIQRCDPAPFYLFDEIDSALDPAHRAAVANMIKKQSEKAQFITTTFRPELVTAAKKHYGITFKNKVSTIKAIKKSKALEIIRAEAEQEQDRAETTLQLPVTPLILHPPAFDEHPTEPLRPALSEEPSAEEL
jgi:structural maintenance of chromosome 3 (chondroitin sulfate proteoglycan 6)